MDITITGSTGFIGHRLSQALSSQHNIVGISTNQKRTKNITSIKNDILSQNFLKKKIISDSIIHLAAISEFSKCEENPANCFRTNILGTLNMLEMARKTDANLIFSSTSHVYGKPKLLPINEKSKICYTSVYATSKILAEQICKEYAKKYDLNISILRLFSVYGPNASPQNIISKIISQVKNESTISLGNIHTKRDFIFVDDVIQAFTLIVNKQKNGLEIFNVCTNESTSINQICKKLIQISGKKIEVFSDKNTSRKNDVPEMRGSFLKLNKTYNWKPQTLLDKGLRKTIYSHKRLE
jgi:UDP-glucose 4-epimerase